MEFAPLAQLRGLPHHGIGRSCKAGKEEIVGLMVALERFAAEDPDARRARWIGLLRAIMETCGATENVTSTLLDDRGRAVPMLRVVAEGGGPMAVKLAAVLRSGSPAIHCQMGQIADGILLFSPLALGIEDARIIGNRLRELDPLLAG
jgi:L-seryl-tRNA(Ser) seleniumtransferase